MQLFKIPLVNCPFPSHENLELERRIEAHTNKWLKDFHLLDSESSLLMYQKQRFSAMIVRSYPFGNYEELSAWCDLNTLLFLVDDQLDEELIITNREELINYESVFLSILENGNFDESTTQKEHQKVFYALLDFWNRIKKTSSVRWQGVFIQNIKDMFAGGMWQLQHNINGTNPSLKDYMRLRQYLGAAHLATDSLEVTANIELPDPILNAVAIKELTINARNAICFANDLFSFGKEVAQSQGGAEFNIVTILARERKISILDAITQAVVIHDQEVTNFIECTKEIFIYDNDTNRMLRKYVDALGYLMKGNIDWSTTITTRYPHVYGNE